jgi:hypothetical protein
MLLALGAMSAAKTGDAPGASSAAETRPATTSHESRRAVRERGFDRVEIMGKVPE